MCLLANQRVVMGARVVTLRAVEFCMEPSTRVYSLLTCTKQPLRRDLLTANPSPVGAKRVLLMSVGDGKEVQRPQTH